MARAYLALIFAFLLLLVGLPLASALTVRLLGDYLEVEVRVEVTDAPSLVEVETIGWPVEAVAYYEETGEPVVFEVGEDGSILLYAYENGTVTLVYYVMDRVFKGDTWFVNFTAPEPVILILPSEVVVLAITPEPDVLALNAEAVALSLPPGPVYVEYVLLPPAATSLTTTTQAPVETGAPVMEPAATETITHASRPSPATEYVTSAVRITTTTVQPIVGPVETGLLVGVVAAAVAIAGLRIWRKRRSGGGAELEIEEGPPARDERDEAILNALREGKKTLSEICEATGLDKSSVHRRLNSYIKAGLVKKVKVGATPFYYLAEQEPRSEA